MMCSFVSMYAQDGMYLFIVNPASQVYERCVTFFAPSPFGVSA
jgi:hypothetical protein